MTWTKLLATGGGAALLIGSLVSLNNCTVVDCTKMPNEPVCQNTTTDGSTPKDSATGDSSSGGDAASDSAADAGSCPAIGPNIGDGGTNYVDYGSQACNDCMSKNCCAEATACFSDVGMGDHCADFNECLDPCSMLMGQAQMICIDACKTSHMNSNAKWYAQDTCLTNKCNAQCM